MHLAYKITLNWVGITLVVVLLAVVAAGLFLLVKRILQR